MDKTKLLASTGNQRFYKLPINISKGMEGRVFESTPYIVISDSPHHAERLVFPLYIEEGFTETDIQQQTPKCVRIEFLEIHGDMTMMIYGGDPSSIREDGEYITELIELSREISVEVD